MSSSPLCFLYASVMDLLCASWIVVVAFVVECFPVADDASSTNGLYLESSSSPLCLLSVSFLCFLCLSCCSSRSDFSPFLVDLVV